MKTRLLLFLLLVFSFGNAQVATFNSVLNSYNITASSASISNIISSSSNVTVYYQLATGSASNVALSPTYGGSSNSTGTWTVPFNISGLTPNTTYYFRFRADNASGTSYSTTGSFTTLTALPTISVTSYPATYNGATINYLLNANGYATTSLVRYGLTSGSLANQATGSSTSGTTAVASFANLSGLASNTTYYYQVEATNSIGTATTAIGSFTTPPQTPGIYSVTASSITTNSASINYSLWDKGLATTSIVRYGLASGSLTSQITGFSVSGDVTVPGNVTLSGLNQNTTYYYQVEATNSAGISTSIVASFTTLALPTAIAEYNFDNTYNNLNGNTPFANIPGVTSFVPDRNAVANSAIQVVGDANNGTFCNVLAPTGSQARTISFWYKTPSHAGFKSLFSYGLPNQYQTFGAYFGANGNIVFQGFSYDHDFSGSYALNTWRHLVITFDATDVKLYMNGTLVGSIPRTLLNTGAGTNFRIGNNTITMQFDDLKIYNYALGQAEITNLYNYNQIENPAPPIITNLSEIPTTSTVTVNYTLNTNSGLATSLIKYGLTDTSLTSQISGFSTNNLATNGVTINGLLPNTTYYYQIESTNNLGTTLSSIESFTTLTEQTIAEYNFDNTYSNLLGTAPFASNAGTSFTTDRHNNANGAINLSLESSSSATIANLPYGNAPRTVSVWVKLNNYDTGSFINPVFYYGTLSNNNMFGGTVDNGETSIFGYNNNYTVTTTNNLSTWYHYVYVYDGTTAKIYKDGVLLGSQAKSWNTINDNDLFRIGASFAGAGSFNGAIDDLKIYNYELSQTAITNLFINNTLSSSDFTQNNLEVKLYPNPVRDILNIDIENDIQSIEIYNIQGQKVLSSNQKQINVADLATGMYMVRIQDVENNIATKKVVIK